MKRLKGDDALRRMKAKYRRIDAKTGKYDELTQQKIKREIDRSRV